MANRKGKTSGSKTSGKIHSLYKCKFQIFITFYLSVGKYLNLVRQGTNRAVNWYLHALLVVAETSVTLMEGTLAMFSGITHTHILLNQQFYFWIFILKGYSHKLTVNIYSVLVIQWCFQLAKDWNSLNAPQLGTGRINHAPFTHRKVL